jgi:hypothetical protein
MTEDGHHLILGEIEDYLTGEQVTETHDERYRQKIARLLIEQKGYQRGEVLSRYPLTVAANEKRAVIPVDFIINCNGKRAMLIKYGPGSLVTRHRPALAMARLLAPYQLPLAVVTNGESAHTLETRTSKVLAEGLAAIPDATWVGEFMVEATPATISARQREMAERVVYCYEIDGACPCDTTVCRL